MICSHPSRSRGSSAAVSTDVQPPKLVKNAPFPPSLVAESVALHGLYPEALERLESPPVPPCCDTAAFDKNPPRRPDSDKSILTSPKLPRFRLLSPPSLGSNDF